jgi:N-acetylneuraminic acid mutarotase
MPNRCVALAVALGLAAPPGVFACDIAHGPLPHATLPKTLSPLWVGPAFSGTWFAPERSGEGISLQILDNGAALALWFTYPPAGAAGQQAWIYAQDGRVEGDRVIFDAAITTRGPRFGAAFNPASLQPIPWGTLELRFSDCNTASLTYSGPAAWGSGSRTLTRLTSYAELECSGKRRLTSGGTRAIEGLKQRTALWFDPAHNGEGWVAEELPDGRTQFFWYTYDANGEQAWVLGVAPTSGDHISIPDMYRPVGTNFGAAFNANAVQRSDWGRVDVDFSSCNAGELRYQSSVGAFGSGTLRPVRVTRLAGTSCVDAAPALPTGGSWSAGVRMPTAKSEVAANTVGGSTYIGGGFGDPLAFYRYDSASASWTSLARVPGGRDHPLLAIVGGDIFFTGGYTQEVGDQANPGWRYSIAQDRWEAAPELPFVAASSAAQLNGFAYFGSLSGDLFQYNPRTRAIRQVTSPRNVARDHSQVVAFQGEIWMMGGRGGSPFIETGRVAIFDPASETWREGPVMNVSRAGFAAAATDTLLIIAGGEALSSLPYHTIKSMEAIVAGGSRWTSLPDLPSGVHGVPGAIHGNAFYLMGGSGVAGTASNVNDVQVYRW